MTALEQQVAAALDECFPPRISGESASDYQQRAKAVVAIRVAAALERTAMEAGGALDWAAALAELRKKET